MSLYSKLIRLAHEKPETRRHLLPVLAAYKGRMNPAEPFYRTVAQWEKGLQTYRGHLSKSLDDTVRRTSFATGIPERAIRARLLGDAMALDAMVDGFLNDLQVVVEQKSKYSSSYFNSLMLRAQSDGKQFVSL